MNDREKFALSAPEAVVRETPKLGGHSEAPPPGPRSARPEDRLRGEPDLALRRLEAAETLVAEQRLGFVMEPRFLRGAALNAQGAFDEAVACLRDAIAGRIGAMTFLPYGFARLAEALVGRGEHGPSLAAVREGMRAQEETGALRWGAELHRLEGIALLGLDRIEEAQLAFAQALHVARTQQAKSYELRAATSLARLCCNQGRRAEACDLLGSLYGRFTEGFDTADLKEAKALLNESA